MAGFVPIAKTFREAIGYSALNLVKEPTFAKVAIPIASGAVAAGIAHNDEHPVASTIGGYAIGDGLAVAAMIAGGAMKYMK